MTGDEIDMTPLQAAIGTVRSVEDDLAPDPARGLAAALGEAETLDIGDPLPPLRHWLYFREHVARSAIGPDGHPRLGGFLPAIPFPRRMWASGALRFHRDLRLGARVERVTRIEDFRLKQGRQGSLLFATLSHTLSDAGGVAIEETQNLVYRPASPAPAVPVAIPPGEAMPAFDWQDEIHPDPVLLFRFSAATNNSHRIHYDLAYAREVEHYPDLVVHGPLSATLLLDSARRRLGGAIVDFRFRGVSPLYVSDHLLLCGRQDDAIAGRHILEARTGTGRLVMSAEVDMKDGDR